MKKVISLVLGFMLMIAVIPFNVLADSNERFVYFLYEDKFHATFNEETSTLTISGKGTLGDTKFYDTENLMFGNPMFWDDYDNSIKYEDKVINIAQNVVIDEGITAIGEYVFFDFSKLKTLTLPSTLKRIGKAAFSCCTKLEKIVGGNNVTQIDGGAFIDCKSLKSVSFPNVTKLDDNKVITFATYSGFYKGDDIANYSGAYNLGAFTHCRSLESVYLPKVKVFGDRTFFDCQKLKTINDNNILNNVTSLGVSVFHNCKSLKSISLPKVTSLYSDRISKGKYGHEKNFIEGTFSNCDAIESVNIPNVKVIGANTFYQCKKLKKINANNKLANVTYLGAGAFTKCESLEKISLPRVKELKMAKWADDDLGYVADRGWYEYFGDWVIFNDLGYKNYGTFEGCTKLKSISVPNVQTVGARAFYSCKSLKKISLPKVKELGSSAFFNCIDLSEVNMPKLKTLNTSTWINYKVVHDYYLPDHTPYIRLIETPYYRGTFEKCVKLKKITSTSLANVGKYDFKDCTRLQSITLGKNLKSIGDSAFYNNKKLKSVNIKSTKLNKVGKSAFSKIYSKAKFTVPKSKLKKYKKLIKKNGLAPKNVKFIGK